MARRPGLPERRNHLLEDEKSPGHEILVERRCLGQTELKVKPGQVGTANATKPENLGVLDYAHLRVPLPKDLAGSGIFLKGADRKWPSAYFLMRRSSDGFVSATGMFKAAFPFSSPAEEQIEKDYIKSLEQASNEEIAGNVWIDPGKALDLADEYGIKLWIAALLDPEPITHGTSDPKKAIRSPPPYLKEMANGIGRSPEKSPEKGAGRRSARGARSLRSESPVATSKSKATARKMATPRKPRKARGGTLSSVDEAASVNGEEKTETVKVEVETTTLPDANGDDLETTKVNVSMPSDHPDFKIPENPAEMLAKARDMVKEAAKIERASSSRANTKKRKAEDMIDENDEAEAEAALRANKRPMELELRKEKIKRRALAGIAASLAIGALIPSIMAAFPW